MYMNILTAVAVSFVLRAFGGTEGVGEQFVEVCVQIVVGTLNKDASVDVLAVGQTATGNY